VYCPVEQSEVSLTSFGTASHKETPRLEARGDKEREARGDKKGVLGDRIGRNAMFYDWLTSKINLQLLVLCGF
jgi:hypothetical protein